MKALGVLFAIGAMGLAGCAATRGYNGALSDQAAPSGNAHRFAAAPERAFRAAAGALVQRGFTVEQADSAMGLIKASRNLQDPKNSKVSYSIIATAYVVAVPDSPDSTIMLSASQQTVLHRQTHHWTGIIGPLAIPTRKEYQTIVTGEGSITDGAFYKDFFAAVERGLSPSGPEASVLTSAADKPVESMAVRTVPSAQR